MAFQMKLSTKQCAVRRFFLSVVIFSLTQDSRVCIATTASNPFHRGVPLPMDGDALDSGCRWTCAFSRDDDNHLMLQCLCHETGPGHVRFPPAGLEEEAKNFLLTQALRKHDTSSRDHLMRLGLLGLKPEIESSSFPKKHFKEISPREDVWDAGETAYRNNLRIEEPSSDRPTNLEYDSSYSDLDRPMDIGRSSYRISKRQQQLKKLFRWGK